MKTEDIRIILASKSPRRKELIEGAGFKTLIIPSDADENIEEKDPAELVKKLSEIKALSVYELIKDKTGKTCGVLAGGSNNAGKTDVNISEEDVVLGADTVVYAGGRILGKPADKEDARDMIKLLAGNVHSVFTGFTLVLSNGQKITDYSETKVYVYPMSDEEIEEYISTNEPYDKAGAYGIQGIFGKYVEKIDGDYNNVVGLPVSKIIYILKNYEN